jgi:hypothetical protein
VMSLPIENISPTSRVSTSILSALFCYKERRLPGESGLFNAPAVNQ